MDGKELPLVTQESDITEDALEECTCNKGEGEDDVPCTS